MADNNIADNKATNNNTIIGYDSTAGYRRDGVNHPNKMEIDIGVSVMKIPLGQGVEPYVRPYAGVDFSTDSHRFVNDFYFRTGAEAGAIFCPSEGEKPSPWFKFWLKGFGMTGIQAGKDLRVETQGGVQLNFWNPTFGTFFFKTSAGVVKPASEAPLFPTARVLLGMEGYIPL